MITKFFKYNEGIKWYSKGNFEEEDSFEEPEEENNFNEQRDIINIGDRVHVCGTYRTWSIGRERDIYLMNWGEVINIFRGSYGSKEIERLVIKFDGRDDLYSSAKSDKNDVASFAISDEVIKRARRDVALGKPVIFKNKDISIEKYGK